MARSFVVVVFLAVAFGSAHGQWQMQESRSTASLRGVHAVDGAIAWASGTGGTVLKTVDGGLHWRRCATPPGADQLDFRGVWAWDAMTAVVMSSGPGEQSRVYRTKDGCKHWTEELRNSEKEGFWDALVFQTPDSGTPRGAQAGVLIGDPVRGRFDTRVVTSGQGWFVDEASCVARPDEAAFAASNSSVVVFGPRRYMIGTGGKGGPRILTSPLLAYTDGSKPCQEASVPIVGGSESAGVFSLAFRDLKSGVAVGGDYRKPDESSGTAARTSDGGLHWTAAAKPPHGYRSGVAWYAEAKVWVAVGTNGSDISRDDGKTWQRLDDENWNSISVPFAVGPKGRIGKLRAGGLK